MTGYVPSASAATRAMRYAPPVAVPVPMRLPPIVRWTVEPDSAEPVNRGRVMPVIPSPAAPVSSSASRPGGAGAPGGVVSILSENPALDRLTLPTESVAVAVTE